MLFRSLFATLDTTQRELRLPGGRPAILSDTVGFISDLPHELVAAFRATLEEVEEADLVLHVRDIADDASDAQAADVAQVLADLGVEPTDPRLLEVWNKADRLDPDTRAELEARAGRRRDAPPAVLVSAVTGVGCDDLLETVAGLIDDAPPLTADLAAGEGEALAWLYRHGRVTARDDRDDGSARLHVRLDPQALGRFERAFPRVPLAAEPLHAAAE